MIPCSDDVRHTTDKSLAPFHRNRRRLPRKQPQHESYSKANRQLVKRDPPSSSGGIDLGISSPNTFTRNGKSFSDDVCHCTDESFAQFHRRCRTVSRRLLRTIQQSSLRDNPPSVSGQITSQIPSNQLSL
ncbi:unnamed protein product [Protopolystoma xenopodis]|uniref:Uncharacterized protein n=1 Tax=Protopolystoma xenopodis TaxID=117903 RepID=A0A3S5BUM7_9PLAT|nr:unnamed protein product [Protopolystoma xenopodis]